MIALFICILFLTVDPITSQQQSTRECLVRTAISFATPNSYVTTCRCPPSSENVVGRVQTSISGPFDAARTAASVRCFRAETRTLTHICQEDVHEFLRAGNHTSDRCVNETPPNEEEQQISGALQFETSTCEVGVIDFSQQDLTSLVMVCRCAQTPDISVNYGRAQFNPLSQQELGFVMECVETQREQLQLVCLNSPFDFVLQALQSLQTCCKRARTMFNTKFECAPVVPNDVSGLKVIQ